MRQAKLYSIGILSLSIVIMLSLVQPKLPFASLLSAQSLTCSDVVKQALDAAVKVCNELGRNKVCYVNGSLTAQPKEGITDFTFNNPGDVVAIKDLGTLQASPYDEAQGTWGVAMLRVQASLPGTNVGQGVTMLAFGDTQVTDASSDGTLNAFYLRTGTGAPGCAEMPRNGVLLDSPTGEKVNMTVNGVQLKIGSTVFLFADGSEDEKNPTLWLHTLEGSVEMTSDGVTVTVPAGQQGCVPLRDEDSNEPIIEENGPPCQPTDIEVDHTRSLPTTELTTLSDTPPSDETPAPTEEPTAVPTRVNTRVPTAVPTDPPPADTPVPPQPTAAPTSVPTEEAISDNMPPSNCQIDFFTANPTSAFFGQEVQLSWSASGSINFVQLIDPNGNTNEAASADTRSYQFGSYQEGLPEGWTLQVFCTDESTQTAGVTVNPAPPGTQEVQPPSQPANGGSNNDS
jgi:hypothetical protein